MSTVELAVNKLAKWRMVLAGWQLGTRPKGEPESDAVRDHREATLLLRAETTALMSLLIEKGVFTLEEWAATLEKEALLLDQAYERKFPGFTTAQHGVEINVAAAQETMKGWRP